MAVDSLNTLTGHQITMTFKSCMSPRHFLSTTKFIKHTLKQCSSFLLHLQFCEKLRLLEKQFYYCQLKAYSFFETISLPYCKSHSILFNVKSAPVYAYITRKSPYCNKIPDELFLSKWQAGLQSHLDYTNQKEVSMAPYPAAKYKIVLSVFRTYAISQDISREIHYCQRNKVTSSAK